MSDGLIFLLGVLQERGLSVQVSPEGKPSLRGPSREVTEALRLNLELYRNEIIDHFRPAPAPVPREWLWQDGHRYTESPDDDTFAREDWHPTGAWWWRSLESPDDWRLTPAGMKYAHTLPRLPRLIHRREAA